MITAGLAFYKAELTKDYCGTLDANDQPETNCAEPEAPKGTQLPITPEFKNNLTARYNFELGGMDAYWQGTFVYVGKRYSDMRLVQREIIGDLPSYETFDFAVGIKKDSWSLDFFVSNLFDKRGQLNRFLQCQETVCGNTYSPYQPTDGDGNPVGDPYPVPPQYANGQIYVVPNQPRTFTLRFTQEF
jgi:hypothetical protein